MEAITVRRCTYDDIEQAPNASDLFGAYAFECAIPELRPFDPQGDVYRAMEANGSAQFLGAWRGDVLIGFAVVVVSIVPHFGKTLAVTESLFVLEHERKGGAGMELLRQAEIIARMAGAVGMGVSAPIDSKLAQVLDLHGSYRPTNVTFFRGFA